MAQIGDVIGGRYKILEEIGRGGMSIVYLAINMCTVRIPKIESVPGFICIW